MKFIKIVLGTIVGIFLFFFIAFASLGLIGLIANAFSGDGIKDNSVLVAKFNNPISEKSEEDPFSNFSPMGGSSSVDGLNDIIAGIEAGKNDDRIKGMYMELSGVDAGFASLSAIRDAILDFKKSGKWVYAYGEAISQKAFYLGSVADSIFVNPEGILEFKGFAANRTFFKNMLEKLEVDVQVFKVGEFKSAVEPFIKTEMSDENRQQTKEFLTDFYNIFLDDISAQRSISSAELHQIADNAKVQNAEDAVQYNLADLVAYKSDVLSIMSKKLGQEKEKEKFNAASIMQLAAIAKEKKNKAKDKIAVVYAYGSIEDGSGKNGTIGSKDYIKTLRKIRLKDNIKAMVLRVNSGGGSALASENIWYEIEQINKNIPVVVSMGDYAASGGYYISCNADKIFAEKNTLTGSIGVFGMFPNMQGFWNNKVGLTFDVEKTAEFADILSTNRPTTEAEGAIIQQSVNDIYDIFLKRVAEGRNLTIEQVDEIAKGRVWSGAKAKQLGLVDEIGGMESAIKAAAELASLEEYKTMDFPYEDTPFEKIQKQFSSKMKTKVLKEEFGPLYKQLQNINEVLKIRGIQARMPFELEIH